MVNVAVPQLLLGGIDVWIMVSGSETVQITKDSIGKIKNKNKGGCTQITGLALIKYLYFLCPQLQSLCWFIIICFTVRLKSQNSLIYFF